MGKCIFADFDMGDRGGAASGRPKLNPAVEFFGTVGLGVGVDLGVFVEGLESAVGDREGEVGKVLMDSDDVV